MAQYGFFFDDTRCTGCRTCTMACRDYHDNPLDVAFRKVYDVEGGTWAETDDGAATTDCFMYHVSQPCNHCVDPACVKVCPTTAMHKDAETGLVCVDASKCIGCGYCAMACPYGVPKVDRSVGRSVKCDGCVDRVKEGKNPICMDACPLRAIDFGEITALRSAHSGDDWVQQVYPLPDASITHPNVLIKPSAPARTANADTAFVANPKEVQ